MPYNEEFCIAKFRVERMSHNIHTPDSEPLRLFLVDTAVAASTEIKRESLSDASIHKLSLIISSGVARCSHKL